MIGHYVTEWPIPAQFLRLTLISSKYRAIASSKWISPWSMITKQANPLHTTSILMDCQRPNPKLTEIATPKKAGLLLLTDRYRSWVPGRRRRAGRLAAFAPPSQDWGKNPTFAGPRRPCPGSWSPWTWPTGQRPAGRRWAGVGDWGGPVPRPAPRRSLRRGSCRGPEGRAGAWGGGSGAACRKAWWAWEGGTPWLPAPCCFDFFWPPLLRLGASVSHGEASKYSGGCVLGSLRCSCVLRRGGGFEWLWKLQQTCGRKDCNCGESLTHCSDVV